MRKPWFEILSVTEARGRSMHDIVVEVSRQRRVRVEAIRGRRQDKRTVEARREAMIRIMRERDDLTSTQVAVYFNRESSTIRHHWNEASG